MANAQAATAREADLRQTAKVLIVRALSARATTGSVEIGGSRYRCALGRSGRRARKREGDGATPIGCYELRFALWRRDRTLPPTTGLRVRPIKASDGWCDADNDRNYNRLVQHPYPASAEHLMREDRLYDLIVVIGHNDRPRQKGMGSAIFMHLARPGYSPTAGCVALSERDLRQVMRRLGRTTRVVIAAR